MKEENIWNCTFQEKCPHKQFCDSGKTLYKSFRKKTCTLFCFEKSIVSVFKCQICCNILQWFNEWHLTVCLVHLSTKPFFKAIYNSSELIVTIIWHKLRKCGHLHQLQLLTESHNHTKKFIAFSSVQQNMLFLKIIIEWPVVLCYNHFSGNSNSWCFQ